MLSLHSLQLIHYSNYSPQARGGSEETYTKQNFPGGLPLTPVTCWCACSLCKHLEGASLLLSFLKFTELQWLKLQFLVTGSTHLPSPPACFFPLRLRHLSDDYKEAKPLLLEIPYDAWSPNHRSVPRLAIPWKEGGARQPLFLRVSSKHLPMQSFLF